MCQSSTFVFAVWNPLHRSPCKELLPGQGTNNTLRQWQVAINEVWLAFGTSYVQHFGACCALRMQSLRKVCQTVYDQAPRLSPGWVLLL